MTTLRETAIAMGDQLSPLFMRKCAVWIKRGKVVQERWVMHDEPTMWQEVPGCILYIASYDHDGKLSQIDLYNGNGIMVCADPNGVVVLLPETKRGCKEYPEDA